MTVLCGAVVVSILSNFAGDGSTGKLLKLVGGLFLSLTMISAFLKLDFGLLENIPVAYLSEADAVAAEGDKIARETMGTIIKEEIAEYILDKAKELDAQIHVEVMVDDRKIPAPHSVRILGDLTGEQQKVLADFMESELNIPKERQQWIGEN